MSAEDVSRMVKALSARAESVIELDVIGEALGNSAITHEEIEQIFVGLERAGKTIGSAQPGASSQLPLVLTAARQLKSELGHAPSVEQTATRAGVPEADVRKALMLVQVMQR